jgi:tryptophanyl-tRNA synthetase
MKNIVLTGDRPTGKLHLGHFVGSIQNRIKLQEKYDPCFYMVADIQALTDNAENPEKVRQNAFEVVLDNLATGVDPKKTAFFIQSQIPEIAELTILFLNLVTLARLKRNPTVKSEMLQNNFKENVPAGFLAYPVSQTADILCVHANIVPGGEDQVPIIEQGNEIISKFNSIYGKTFRKIKPFLSETPRLVGIDGNSKASKSLENTIYLGDLPKEIERKVMMMYTDPNHIKITDPGKVEGNVVFTYLDAFDKNKKDLEKLKEKYKKGGVGDIETKKRLIKILKEVIAPIRERRKKLEKKPEYIEKILREGREKTRETTKRTIKDVKKAIKINYF